MTRRSVALLIVVTGLVFALAGCGGKSDEDQVRSVVNDYYAALHSEDGATACEKLTKKEAEKIANIGGASCSATLGKGLLGKPYGLQTAASVEVDGDSATVHTDGGVTLELSKENGDWLIEGPRR